VYALVDLTHNFFLSPIAFNRMVSCLSTKRSHQRASHSVGLSLSLKSIKDGEMRSFMLDYAYKPEELLNISHLRPELTRTIDPRTRGLFSI
jgi:hypothetical protein